MKFRSVRLNLQGTLKMYLVGSCC